VDVAPLAIKAARESPGYPVEAQPMCLSQFRIPQPSKSPMSFAPAVAVLAAEGEPVDAVAPAAIPALQLVTAKPQAMEPMEPKVPPETTDPWAARALPVRFVCA